jgi:hypothetical protein
MPTKRKRYEHIRAAFAADGWTVVKLRDGSDFAEYGDYIGVTAERPAVCSGECSAADAMRRKRAYYVEGRGFDRGWLMGYMAETEAAIMCTEYVTNVIFDFLSLPGLMKSNCRLVRNIKRTIVDTIAKDSLSKREGIPPEYIDEIEGLVRGARAAKPDTAVNFKDLWALNFGIDCLVAHIYTQSLRFEERRVAKYLLRVPLGCNAFTFSGSYTEGGVPLFGRDFMFPTAGVFQDVGCLVIGNPQPALADEARPEPAEGEERLHVAMLAPGMIGAVCAMNESGFASGIEMLPHPLCEPERPGFNSLGMVRDIGARCASVDEGASRIAGHLRGTSWIYAMADRTGRGLMAETCKSLAAGTVFPYLDTVPRWWKKRLPDVAEFEAMRVREGDPAHDRGVIGRSWSYSVPRELFHVNRRLLRAYNWNLRSRVREISVKLFGLFAKLISLEYLTLSAFVRDFIRAVEPVRRFRRRAFCERGVICKSPAEDRTPGPYYYPPQRRQDEGWIIVTNHCVSPEMRSSGMTEWMALLAGEQANDFQYRYDKLNHLAIEAYETRGPFDFETAWGLIDFLRPDPSGPCPEYYGNAVSPRKRRADPDYWRKIYVHGAVNLCDLVELRFRSLWGYYGDEAVEIRLGRYRI